MMAYVCKAVFNVDIFVIDDVFKKKLAKVENKLCEGKKNFFFE